MISEIRSIKCKRCQLKKLAEKRLRIFESKRGKIYWRVKCSNCGKIQDVWIGG